MLLSSQALDRASISHIEYHLPNIELFHEEFEFRFSGLSSDSLFLMIQKPAF